MVRSRELDPSEFEVADAISVAMEGACLEDAYVRAGVESIYYGSTGEDGREGKRSRIEPKHS
jgi:hypothetical protein